VSSLAPTVLYALPVSSSAAPSTWNALSGSRSGFGTASFLVFLPPLSLEQARRGGHWGWLLHRELDANPFHPALGVVDASLTHPLCLTLDVIDASPTHLRAMVGVVFMTRSTPTPASSGGLWCRSRRMFASLPTALPLRGHCVGMLRLPPAVMLWSDSLLPLAPPVGRCRCLCLHLYHFFSHLIPSLHWSLASVVWLSLELLCYL
jgi:hypothetical protein